MSRFAMIAALIALAAVAACDFPSDPPRKSSSDAAVEDTTPPIDKSATLLPLLAGNWWEYAVLRDSTEIQQTRRAVMRQLAYYGEVYYLMRYDFDHGLPPHRDVGFPPLLQLSARGVTFYNALLDDTMKIRSTPMVQFTLPYPSPADTVFVAGNADYRVKVVSKSQKLILRPSNAVMTCYVYEVTRNALPSAPPQYTFYVAPGSAILRIDTQIDQDHIQFSTYNWFVQ